VHCSVSNRLYYTF